MQWTSNLRWMLDLADEKDREPMEGAFLTS